MGAGEIEQSTVYPPRVPLATPPTARPDVPSSPGKKMGKREKLYRPALSPVEPNPSLTSGLKHFCKGQEGRAIS